MHTKPVTAQYWPSTSSSCEFGNFSVQLTKEVIGKDYTTRDFLVTKVKPLFQITNSGCYSIFATFCLFLLDIQQGKHRS